jgi:short-subunit dehydrogenase
MAKGDKKFWVASPEKAAQQILQAIKEKKKIAYITKRWRLVAAFLKYTPKFIYRKI